MDTLQLPDPERIKQVVDNVFDYTQTIDERVVIAQCDSPVAARGELTLVSGPKKSFKSHVCAHVASAALGGEPERCLGFEGKEDGLTVMFIDTEQSKASVSQISKLILEGADLPDNEKTPSLITYCWRNLSVSERREALKAAVKEKRPDIVIVDNIADTVRSINDETDCSGAVSDMLTLAEEGQCAIICVIHQNPFSNKERGHLGTILANKTYGCLTIKKYYGNVLLTSDGTRKKPFADFCIEFNENIGTVVKSGFYTNSNNGKRGLSQKTITMINYISSLFTEDIQYLSQKQIADALMTKFGIKEKNRTQVTRVIKRALDNNIISQDPQTKFYSVVDDLPLDYE